MTNEVTTRDDQLPAEVSPLTALLADPQKLKELPIETLERMFALQERYDAQQAKRAYFEAMASFQHTCPTIVRTKSVGGQYNYAPLDVILRVIKKTERGCGFSHRWETEHQDGGGVLVTCLITHVEGHTERTAVKIPPTKGRNTNAAQDSGIEITYGQRRSLLNGFGLGTADEDNDAQTIVGDDYERITDNQAADLHELLTQAQANRAAFLAWVSTASGVDVESLSELPAAFYGRAVAKVQQKLRGA